MALNIDIKLSGHRELEAKLSRLDRKVQVRVAAKAVRRAAKPLVAAMKSAAPYRTGRLRRSIGMVVRYYSGSGTTMGYVGPRHPEGTHGYILEHGSGPRYTESGRFSGSLPPHPFVQPVFDAHHQSVQKQLAEELATLIEQEARG